MRIPARIAAVVLTIFASLGFAIAAAVADDAPANTERTEPALPPSDAAMIRRLEQQAASLPATAPTREQPLVESTAAANFRSGSDELTASAAAALDALVTSLAGMRIDRILIVAHTDSLPPVRAVKRRFRTNAALSSARAARIAVYLQRALGLPESAFAIEGRGAREPIATNSTAAGRAKNRRAVLRIWARAPEPPAPPAVVPPSAPTLESRSDCIGDGPGQLSPVRITVDGKPLDPREATNEADRQRCVDVALARADIQLRYDPLEQSPFLNAIALPQDVAPGERVRFSTYINYPRFIERAQIRIYTASQGLSQAPLAVIELPAGGTGEWTVPAPAPSPLRVTGAREQPAYYRYVLRVYDHAGRFDETKPRRIDVRAPTHSTQSPPANEHDVERAVYGENALTVRNIPIAGGAITVSGNHVPIGDHVFVQGVPVPVDDQQRFVARQIVPRGPQQITVRIVNERDEGLEFTRNLSVATDDSFFVGIADLTAGQHGGAGPVELVSGDPNLARKDYVDGHLAFYYKGLVKGDWILTAAADTQNQPVRDLFSNFASKDPSELFRRIDPNRYYPVYGDASTTVEDAPTSGKFYVRLEKGDTSVLWGDFQSHLTGTDFLQYSRSLYGADLRYRSQDATRFGERKQNVEAFWAEPGTLASREEFRGTGGSVYYLQNLDVTVGSEQIWVQVRDKDSGIVLSSTQLVPAQDYDVNYMQGRILLHSPLSATADSATVVHGGGLDGNPLFLVVTYEYVPGLTNPDSLARGGHASQWFGDHLEIGLSDFHQGDPGEEQDLRGVDATWRYMPGTYLKTEWAHSQGLGSPTLTSLSGGLTVSAPVTTGAPANAERIEAAVDLGEVTDTMKGRINAYYQDRQANFSGPGQLTPGVGVVQEGASASVQISPTTQFVGKLDNTDAATGKVRSVEAAVEHQLDDHWRLGLGARVDDRDGITPNASAILSQTGDRADVAVTLGYQSVPVAADGATAAAHAAGMPMVHAGWDAYGFVQDTVDRSGTRPDNDRAGIGGSLQASEQLRLGAEASDGSLGVGGKLSTDYHTDDHSTLYLNYTLAADQPDALNVGRSGSLTSGTRYRYDDATSVYAEDRSQTGTGPVGLTQAYGVDFSPDKHWTYGLKIEDGTVSDPLAGDQSVRAVGANLAYTSTQIKYGGGLEWRENFSSLTGSSHTELARNSLTYQLDRDWRLLGTLNWSQTDASANSTLNAAYHEIVMGAAWRPVNDDRWNTLMKITLLDDQPSSAQVNAPGNTIAYAQQSRVADIDATYQTTPWLSIGAKYAIRTGELKPTETPGNWFASQARLGVLRLDLLVAHQWDGMLELRRLSSRETDDQRDGMLVGLYRHLGNHLKIGAGYNFTNYSDNLTDLSYRSRGFFFNTVGKL